MGSAPVGDAERPSGQGRMRRCCAATQPTCGAAVFECTHPQHSSCSTWSSSSSSSYTLKISVRGFVKEKCSLKLDARCGNSRGGTLTPKVLLGESEWRKQAHPWGRADPKTCSRRIRTRESSKVPSSPNHPMAL